MSIDAVGPIFMYEEIHRSRLRRQGDTPTMPVAPADPRITWRRKGTAIEISTWWLSPGRLVISPDGVRYRFRRASLAAVEEIAAGRGGAPRLSKSAESGKGVGDLFQSHDQ